MIDITELDVDIESFYRVMKKHLRPNLTLWAPLEHGPSGFKSVILSRIMGNPLGSIIVSQSDHAGVEWIHASFAWAERLPVYEDLAALKKAVFGDTREAYMVFPRSDKHINMHPYALHLYGRADGSPELPDFTYGGASI